VKADHRHGEGGVVTVEVAALLPVLLLAVALCLSVTGVVRDHIVVQSAAGAGARAAATSTDPGAVRRAAAEAAAGRPVDVALAPARWRPGDLVRVTVRTSSRVAGVTVEVTGRAAARVEPGARP
jgi:Flp pilus assembly protein TadG